MTKLGWQAALESTGVLAVLALFDPRIAGTFPLGLDLPGSDIDVLCHAPDGAAFADAVWDALRDQPGFTLRQWSIRDRPVIASFVADGFPVEVFGQALPVVEQMGWRHFEAERRLLDLGGEPLRVAVMAERSAGRKTEPAFARVFGLAGEPYGAMLDMAARSDAELRAVLGAAGFG
jgi:hypothetical protein